jgi:hypothetical protein
MIVLRWIKIHRNNMTMKTFFIIQNLLRYKSNYLRKIIFIKYIRIKGKESLIKSEDEMIVVTYDTDKC